MPRRIKVQILPAAKVAGRVKAYYPSMMDCARELGLQASHISECCSGKRKQHKGFTFNKV